MGPPTLGGGAPIYPGSIPGKKSFAEIAEIGDWQCPRCDDLQFKRNNSCRKCGLPKWAASQMSLAAGLINMNNFMPPPEPKKRNEVIEEDWKCAKCGDVHFAQAVVCRRCNIPRPQK